MTSKRDERRRYLAELMREFDEEYAASRREFPEHGPMMPLRKIAITGLIASELARARLIGFDGEREWRL